MPAKRDSVLRVVDPGIDAATDAAIGGIGIDWSVVPIDVAGCADALAEWRRLATVFVDQPTRFREADRAAIGMYAISFAIARLAGAELLRDGVVVAGRGRSDAGRKVKSPAMAVWSQASGQLRFWVRELALSPDSRARTGLADKAEVHDVGNPFD